MKLETMLTKFAGPLPRACQIMRNVLLTSALSIFDLFLKQLQLQSTQTAILEQFFEARAMDTNSSNNSSSSYCFLFELCAREAASLGAIAHGDNPWFSIRSFFFEAISGTVFFSKMVLNGTPDGLRNVTKSGKNDTWNKDHKTYCKCAKFDTLGLARNAFSNRMVAKNH